MKHSLPSLNWWIYVGLTAMSAMLWVLYVFENLPFRLTLPDDESVAGRILSSLWQVVLLGTPVLMMVAESLRTYSLRRGRTLVEPSLMVLRGVVFIHWCFLVGLVCYCYVALKHAGLI